MGGARHGRRRSSGVARRSVDADLRPRELAVPSALVRGHRGGDGGGRGRYVAYGFSSGSWTWPGGGSPPGFAYGVLGGGIILFEMLLWPRKSLWRGWRLGRTKLWMTAHIWLGLLTLPLLLLHGGFHFSLSGLDTRVRSHVASGPGGR